MDASSVLPLIHPFPRYLHKYGERTLPTRTIGYMAQMLFSTMFNHVFYYHNRYYNLESRALMSSSFNDIITGDGIYGMSEIKQEGQNINRVIPPTRGQSKFSGV